MKASPQTLLIGFLALTTVAASALAWQNYRRLRDLQSTASLASQERADWQRRVWDAEKKAAAAESARPAPAAADSGEATPAGRAPGEGRGGPGGRGGAMMELLANPEFARALSLQQRAALDGRYADLFRKLGLNPAQIDRLKALLVERQNASLDVMAVAREQGLDGRTNRDELRQLVRDAESKVNAEIEGLLGADAYAQYQTYERTQAQRTLVDQLETRLSYSSVPLNDTQADQLVSILAETSPRNNANVAGPAFGGMNIRGAAAAAGVAITVNTPITDEAITRAQAVLAPAQVEALRELQTEQQAQRAMAEALRAANGGGRGGP